VVRAAAMCDGLIRVQDLPEPIRNFQKQTKVTSINSMAAPQEIEEWTSLAAIEGRYVARVLAHTRGNKQAASRVLGVDRKTLDRMIKRHNISFDRASINKSNGFPSELAIID